MATIVESTPQVCPVVGTTNTVLPPEHPKFDVNKPGQVCPVTKATTDHHDSAGILNHPPVEIPSNTNPSKGATSCPALKDEVRQPAAQKLDDKVCPVIGTATNVLPPDHPDMDGVSLDKPCPKTNATLRHHQDKVQQHPPVSIDSKSEMKQCPVVGATA